MTWSSLDGTKLLEEKRTMTFSGDANLRMIDLDITLTAITKIKFGDAKDGVLGIRLARSMQEDSADKGKKDTMAHTGTMVNAEGKEKEAGVWGKTSNWVDYNGDVDGEKVGVAIFDDTQNACCAPSSGTRADTACSQLIHLDVRRFRRRWMEVCRSNPERHCISATGL